MRDEIKQVTIVNESPLDEIKIVSSLRDIIGAAGKEKLKITAIQQKILPGCGGDTAEELASSRWFADRMPPTVKQNLVNVEKRLLKENKIPAGVVYHGLKYREILIKENKEYGRRGFLTVFITPRILATSEAPWGSPHIRTVLLGAPAVISSRGITMGPARARDSIHKEENGISKDTIEKIAGSLLLQAIFYRFLGEGLCPLSDCCIYNPHWRDEMIKALGPGAALCKEHLRRLEEWLNT